MPKIISSYSKIMLSLLSPKMPELSKYASEHSTNNPKSTATLSSKQIQEAVLHPNSIIQQALRVVSEIQKVLNFYNAILDEITEKREHIKLSLIKLQKNDNSASKNKNDKTDTPKDIKIKEIISSLNKELIDLIPSEQEVQAAKDKLSQERVELDKIIQSYEIEWHQHRELYFKQLEEELKKNGIILNTAEKNELRQGSNNILSIEQKLTKLKKLNINVKNQESDFSILIYDAIVAVLSRELKTIDNKVVNNIVENINTIIKEEKNIADKMKKKHIDQYEQIISNIHGLKTQKNKVEQNLDEKDKSLDNIEDRIRSVSTQK